MHHAVTHGADLAEVGEHALLRVGEHLEHLADGLLMVGHRHGDGLLGAVGQLELDERVGEADFLHAPLCEDVLGAAVDELVFDARAAVVEH